MTDQLTTLDRAILGLVDMAPRSGYDIHKLFSETPLATFSSSPGAIYPSLRRLEEKDLLSSTLDTTSEARPRRVYSITKRGLTTLVAWLREPVTREELVSNPKMPVLRFSIAEKRLTPREVQSYLRGFKRSVESYLDELAEYLSSSPPMPLHVKLSLENGVEGFRCQVRWIERAQRKLRTARSASSHKGRRRSPEPRR